MLTTSQIAIFIFCMVGAGISSWNLGRKDGIEATVEFLIDKGILEVEEE
jgi:hypothetical protein